MTTSILTVIIVVYNHGPFLADLFNSLLSQTLLNINILISNDASTDNSDEVIQEFLPRLQKKFSNVMYYQHLENLGGRGRENYNFCVSHPIPSPYMMFIEGDDYLASHNSLHESLTYLIDNPMMDGVHSDVREIFEDGSLKTESFWADNGQHIVSPMTVESQIANNRIFTCALIARTDLYKKAFNCDMFTEKGIFLGDYAASTRLSKIAKIHYLDRPLSVYRWRADSESHRDRELVIESTGHVASLAISGALFEDLI